MAGVAQWIECWTANQRVRFLVGAYVWVMGWLPTGGLQGAVGGMWWGGQLTHISLPLFLPPFLSL